jgi:hypothetical protein
MAITHLIPENQPYFVERIQRLQPDSERRFGTMDTNQMMRHLRNALETAMGEVEMPGKAIPGVGKSLYYVITHVMTTWPGGKIKAPAYWTPPSDREFDAEREALLGALDRFMTHYSSGKPTAPHPMLGTLNPQQWARLNGLHFRHHFRQFGVN